MLKPILIRSLLSFCVLTAPVLAQVEGPAPGGNLINLNLSSDQQAALRQAVRDCREQQSSQSPDNQRTCVRQRLGTILTPEQKQQLTGDRRQPGNGYGYGVESGGGPANLSDQQRAALRQAIEQCRSEQPQQDREAMRACVQQKLGNAY